MNKKLTVSSKVKAKEEVHSFAWGGVGILIVALIFILINGVDWLNISLVVLGILVFAIRIKGMIIFLGLIEILFGVYLIILFTYGSGYTFWSGLFVIAVSIYLILIGIFDVQKYYKIKGILAK